MLGVALRNILVERDVQYLADLPAFLRWWSQRNRGRSR
jgi:hypothetical protein